MLESEDRKLLYAQANRYQDGLTGPMSPREIINVLPDEPAEKILSIFFNGALAASVPEAVGLNDCQMVTEVVSSLLKKIKPEINKLKKEWEEGLEKKHDEALQKHTEVIRDLAALFQDMQNAHHQQLESLQKELDGQQAIIENLENDLDASNRATEEVIAGNRILLAEVEECEEKVETLQNELSEAQARLQKMREERDDVVDRARSAESELMTTRTLLTEAEARYLDATRIGEMWESRFQVLTSESESTKQDIAGIKKLFEEFVSARGAGDKSQKRQKKEKHPEGCELDELLEPGPGDRPEIVQLE